SKTAAEGGFDALPVGYVGLGNASRFGYDVYFWSGSSEGSSAWLRYLAGDRSTVIRSNASNKPFMYSIRCKKDN
ncbi:MAG: hypothetical protein LBH61_05830, partial [Dysgonamonadaceae bacterium]|nr:hypothetical protein [Dysgonamonadaceae bacterium]